FTGGTPASSSAQAPSTVTFSAVGNHDVTLSVSNAHGTSAQSSQTQTIVVTDPSPAIGAVTVSPPNPTVCQDVTFTATGVTGQATLQYGWDINNGTSQGNGTTNPLVWHTTSSTPPGSTYSAQVTVTGVGTAVKSTPFTLNGLVPLPANNFAAPTNDPFA